MLVLLASAFLIAGTDRVAAAQNGDYTYTVSGTAATITGYTGAGGTITIPSTLGVYNTVTIGSKAFFQKTSLISVTIPATVKSIGNSAFSSCTAMTSMYFEGNAPTTGTSWISNHNAALIIYYYQGKTGFSTPTWQGVPTVVLTPLTDFDYQLINGGTAVQITGYHGAGVNFNIPGMINGKPVTSIGSNAFSGKISLTSVIMPATVTSIGEYAFYGCGLISVTIPGSVTSIGNYAFSSCTAMTSMYFEGNAPTTGTSWISNHNAALIIYYYQGKTGFSTPTWNGVPTMVLTPATDFDYQLINGGTAVQITGYHGAGVNVNIPGVINGKPVTSVGDKAFYKKTSLTSVAIPGSVRSIGNYSFYYCSSLTSVTTLGSVTSIGSYVFDYCTSLTSVTVLGSVRSIGDYSFFSCTSLSSVTIPGSVTSIGARAFSYCTSLTSITIPGSVTSIGNYAFSSCTAMTSITIPGSVTSIGNYAFSSCTAMTSMYFEGNAPTTGTSWISNHNAALIIYYYQGKTGFSTPTWQGVPTVVLTPVDVPSVPQNLVATGGNAQVTLTWSPSSSKGGSPIAGYKVYRGMTSGGETLLTTLANVLTYTDTSVTNGQTYYYKLSAVNGVGEGSLSNEASATPATVPSTPQNLVATGGNAQVTLTWSAPASNGGSAITGYKIYRGMTSGGETLLTTLGNTLFYTDTGLTNGQIYYYKVSAVNSKGIGPLSNELSANPSTIPSAPQTLTATEGNGQVVLTWSAPSSNGGSMITGYEIYKGTTSGGETLLTTLGNVLTYADNGLTNGQAYFYTVSAVNSVGEGPLSNEVSAIPTAVPTAPQSLVATRGNAQITLTWTAPVNDGGSPITAYKVYRGTTSGGETLLTSLDNVLTYTDTGLTNGQAYYYKVSAVNAVGEGPQSNEAFATPATVPTAPRSLAAIAGSAQVTLTWSAPANDGGSVIITYSIYRGTTPSTETFLRTVGNVLISVDTGLTNDQIYYYKISSNNSVGEGARSDEACATPATVPTTPRGFQAVPGDSVVDLNWTAPSYAGPGTLTYYMSRDGSQIWSGTGLAYSDTAVTNGIAYSYKLAAQNSIGWGPNCTAVQATPHSGVTVPTAPRGLTATAGDSHIDLNWTAPSSDGGDPITNYKVYQGSASGGEVLLTTIGNVLVYSDTSVTNGQIYYYKVSAVNAVGEGAQSNEVFATPATLPNAPQSLTATRGNAQVTLAWAAPASNGASPITNYRIYRGTTSGGETFLTVLGNVLTYTDTGITNGQKYYYVVSAVNAVGEGPFSNEASATPAFVPTTPTLSSATPGNAQIVLAWSAPSSNGGSPITNYKIYRGATSGGETLLITLGNVLTYTDTSVTNGQTYYYKVSAVNAVGESPLSNEVSATPAAVPSAPQNLVAMGGNTQITLTWVAPSSNGGSPITNFKIYRGTASGGETLLVVVGNVLVYTDASLTNGQIYYYKVSAVNSVGEGPQSNEVSATPATVPSAPSLSSATPGNAQVTLVWTAPSSSGGSAITNYKVYRSTTSGGETFLVTVGNVLTYTNIGLTNGQIYYYKVSAVNAVGEGALSIEVSAVPAAVPSAPQSLIATAGNAQVVLTWSAPASNGGSAIIYYKVYRGTTSGGEIFLMTVGNVLTYTDTSVTNGQTYYYKVSAVNAVGESPLSNEVSATPAAVPSAPQNLVAMGGNTQITLTWVAPSSNGGSPITNFKIYRGTASGGETLLTTLGNVITYTDTSLTNDQVYYYKVSAVNGVGESAQSSETSAVPSGDSFPIIGYALSPTVLSETFTQAPSGLTLSADNAQYAYTEEGLKITLNQGSSALYIQNSDISGNSVRCIVDASSVDLTHVLSLWANFNVISHPGWYYSVKIMLDYDRVYLSPYVWLGSGTPSFSKAVYVYDVRERGTLDILVKVENGNIIVGMDGFESTLKTDYKIFTNLGFDGVTLASESDAWSSPADVVLHRLEIGNNAQIVYHDRLHKTITPWGHDFTLALQIHADDANPAQLALMKYLADNYGVRGEFAAWMDIEDPTSQYSVTDDANYANALHALQSSGWDIGLHAVTDLDTTRAELISLIDQFETEFGPLNSWVDHGNDAQDLYRYGNDPSSSYYISDVLQAKNVMIWVNLESQSQSKAYDLNLDTVMYHNALFPGLDLQKASKDGFPYEELGGWQPIKPVTQDMMSERQRIYASNSAVLLWHDYTLGFTYVEDGGISYSTQSNANMGYPYTLITQSQLYDKGAYVHPSGTWHLKPLAVDYFAAMHQDYDVWYATPREVYDRSIIMDQLIINEGSTTLTITNPTASNLLGLTLFTKEMPSYCLKNGETYYYAHQGAENYQFIIPDVQAGATIVLSKTVLPPSTLLVNEGSATVKTLGNQSELEPMANGDGTVTMSLNVSQGDGEVIVDLSNGQEVPNSVQVSMPVIEGTSMLSTRDDPP